MRGQAKVAVGSILASCLAAMSSAQGFQAGGTSTTDAIAHEIRLLRSAVERQSAITTRAQLLVARLTLQDQRTARLRQLVAMLESQMTNADRQRDRAQNDVRETAQALEEAADQDERDARETGLRIVRRRLAEAEADRSATQARLVKAREELEIEVARYDELERWLTELDKQLYRGE